LSDRSDPVPDAVWNAAAQHYNEQQLAALVLMIALTNLLNRVNTTTEQVAGEWPRSAEAKEWAESAAKFRQATPSARV
jgi:hypothetical protein